MSLESSPYFPVSVSYTPRGDHEITCFNVRCLCFPLSTVHAHIQLSGKHVKLCCENLPSVQKQACRWFLLRGVWSSWWLCWRLSLWWPSALGCSPSFPDRKTHSLGFNLTVICELDVHPSVVVNKLAKRMSKITLKNVLFCKDHIWTPGGNMVIVTQILFILHPSSALCVQYMHACVWIKQNCGLTFAVLRTNWCLPSSPPIWAFSCSSLATSSSICNTHTHTHKQEDKKWSTPARILKNFRQLFIAGKTHAHSSRGLPEPQWSQGQNAEIEHVLQSESPKDQSKHEHKSCPACLSNSTDKKNN